MSIDRAFFENLHEVVNVFEPLRDAAGRPVDWIFHDANRASVQALGLELPQLIGRRASEVLGEGVQLYLDVFRRVHDTGLPWSGEATLGGRQYFSRVFPLGENRIASTRIDVTESRRTEAALRASEAKYRGLFALAERRRAELEAVYDAMADGVMVFDPKGRAILANDAAARQFGYESPEQLQQEMAWFASTYELETADGTPVAVEDWPANRLLRGESLAPVELWTRRRDTGRERFVSYKGEPVLDAAGGVRLAVVIMRDVTQQRRAEEALRDSTSLLRTISDASEDAIFAKDRQGRIRFANPATLAVFGRPAAEVLGKTDRELFTDPELVARLTQTDERIMASGRGEEVEETVPLPDGGWRTWLARKTPFQDDTGRVAGLLGIARDITIRKQAEAALQRANEQLREAARHKDEFLAVLSHELRNPLAPIRNSVFVLERAAPESEQARRARDVIDRQTRHLARLVDDLLDVTRIARGKVKLQRGLVDLCDVVRRTVEDHRGTFAQAGVTLELEAPATPVLVDGDRTRLAQVLENLLGNSAKFTPRGGRTRVVVAEGSAGFAEITVEDDGVGIAPAMLPQIFEPFVQAEATLDRSRGGLGLGLALIKGLLEMHGGTIAARSDGLGRGACFTVRLPGVPRPEWAASAERKPADVGTARRVLVIEDNRDAGDSLVEALELTGHTVEMAHSGPEGLARARAFAPDVVLCDIGLPGMSGFEVARAMRADPLLSGSRLVALSGYALEDDVRKAHEAGFEDHMAKPPDLQALERLFARLAHEHPPAKPVLSARGPAPATAGAGETAAGPRSSS